MIDRSHPSLLLLEVQGLDALGHPRPRRIVTSRQAVCVVSVQALDARARAGDASPGAGALEILRAIGRVGGVRELDGCPEPGVIPQAFVQASDPPVGLQRETALTAWGHVNQYVVGNGSPAASSGALRITSG